MNLLRKFAILLKLYNKKIINFFILTGYIIHGLYLYDVFHWNEGRPKIPV